MIEKNSLTTIMRDITKSAQSWEHMLFTSEGKLELSKCELYMIAWNFNSDGTPTLYNTIDNSKWEVISSFNKNNIYNKAH